MDEHQKILVEADSALLLERAAAEAFAAGAAGLEERDSPPGLEIYATSEGMLAVAAALQGLAREGLRVEAPCPVDAIDWRERWRDGLEPVVVSSRLVVRPSFTDAPDGEAAELVIDPGQAFGTGSHGSTRRALDWIDTLAAEGRLAGARVLDVGCGTGVLALAALALGAREAVGCDIDPLAAEDARANAEANGLEGRFRAVLGSADAVGGLFEVVVANMIRTEQLPLLDAMVERLHEGGVLVLSGLLAEEEATLHEELLRRGLAVTGSQAVRDETGDTWLGLRAERR